MATYSQAGRALAVFTQLGTDILLLEKLTGLEAISQPFHFKLQMLAPKAVDFGKVINQWATVRLTLPNSKGRSINGIISRLGQIEQVVTIYVLRLTTSEGKRLGRTSLDGGIMERSGDRRPTAARSRLDQRSPAMKVAASQFKKRGSQAHAKVPCRTLLTRTHGELPRHTDCQRALADRLEYRRPCRHQARPRDH